MRRWLLVGVVLGLLGCGSTTNSSTKQGQIRPRSVTVFAAASLTEAFTASSSALPQVRPTFNFGGSQQLVTQLTQGAPADVVATADDVSMQRVVAAGLVDPPVVFARTTLVIAVAPGNPKGIGALADLARPDVTVVLADQSVPAGRYARQAIEAAGLKVSPRSLELDVKATLAKVTTGVADAAIVYATDVASSGGKAQAVTFAEAAAPSATVAYRIAVVSATSQRAAAEAYVAAAVDGPVHQALLAGGFS